MKKLGLIALPLMFAIAACDGPRENAGEQYDKEHGEGELMGKGPGEAAGEQLDKAANEEADAIRAGADDVADALEDGELAAPNEQAVVDAVVEQEEGM